MLVEQTLASAVGRCCAMAGAANRLTTSPIPKAKLLVVGLRVGLAAGVGFTRSSFMMCGRKGLTVVYKLLSFVAYNCIELALKLCENF